MKPDDISPVEQLLRLQQRLVVRTAGYMARVGDLVARGSVEPRAYLEAYLELWSGGLDDVGDSLKPRRQEDAARQFPIAQVHVELRPERGDIGFPIPIEVFDRFGDGAVILLSTNGLVRQFDPTAPLRPQLTLGAEQHVRIAPKEIRCDQRSRPEMKIYGVAPLVRGGDRYEALVWGALKGQPKVRFPVATIELTIA
jgi:hypothetical protein